MRLLKLCSIFGLALLCIFSVQADDSAILLSTASLIDADETILYSVILTSGEEAVSDISIELSIPTGFSFVEAIIAPPEIAIIANETSLVWEVAELPADTILGPFTVRVAADESITEIPQSLPVTVTWPEGSSSFETDEVLEPLALEGSLLIDSEGTLNADGEADAVEIGDTGIFIYLPANAVASPTTLSVERLPVPTAEGNELSLLDSATWWCSVIVFHLDPNIEISETAILLVPTRRVLTPGLEGTAFSRNGENEWEILEGLAVFITPSGSHTLVDGFVLADGQALALGVNNTVRVSSEVNSTNIADGTSNTSPRSYVEQDSIVVNRIINR